MADWFSFGAAVIAIIVSLGAAGIAIAAWYETRRQANAAEQQVHDARTPDFDAEFFDISDHHRLQLRLTLKTQWTVTRVRVDIIDEYRYLQFEPGTWGVPLASSTTSRGAETEPREMKLHNGDHVEWSMKWDRNRNLPSQLRIRVTAYPDVPADASEITGAAWFRVKEVPLPPRPMVAWS